MLVGGLVAASGMRSVQLGVTVDLFPVDLPWRLAPSGEKAGPPPPVEEIEEFRVDSDLDPLHLGCWLGSNLILIDDRQEHQ